MDQRRATVPLLAVLLLVGVLAALAAGDPVDATDPPSGDPGDSPWLITPAPTVAADGPSRSTASAPETERVRIDRDVLDDREPRRLRAALSGRIIELDLHPTSSGSPGSATWAGRVVGDDLSSVTIIERDNALHGVVWSADGGHRIHGDTDGSGTALPLRTDLPTAEDDAIPIPAPVTAPDRTDGAIGPATESTAPPAPADGAPPTIRMLIAFTPAATASARALAPGRSADAARRDFAALLIESTNTIYADSGVRGRLELADVTTIPHDLLPDEPDLESLVGGTAHAGVRNHRDNVEADLLAVISGNDHPRYCGVAWLVNTPDPAIAAEWGHSITAFHCALDGLTFAHEIGHNMGLVHDHAGPPNVQPLFPYGYGWSNPAESWLTIQSYPGDCLANSPNPDACTRIPRHSNPARNWITGSPLGSPWPGPKPADAARALNESQPLVASWRGPAHEPGTGATCTIGSDWPCPFNSWERLVDQQWQDFGASGSTAERNAVANRLRTGQQRPESHIADLMTDTSLGAIRSRVVRLYLAYFLRAPDLGGFDFWVDRYRQKPNIVSIASFFARSVEFRNRYGRLGNGAFVDLVYRNVLGRAPDPAGRTYWTNQLDLGRMSRGRVMVGFSDSREFAIRRAPEIGTALLHRAMLDTMPDRTRFETTVDRLRSGDATIEDLIGELARTPEYRARIRS